MSILGTIGAVGAIGGAGIGAIGADKAAGAQADASVQASQIQAQSQREALAEQQRQFGIQQQNIAPWLSAGGSGLSSLLDFLKQGQSGQGPLAAWTGTFKPPTTADLADPNNPEYAGYQFSLKQGIDAMNNSAAAKGIALNPSTLKGLNDYATGSAMQYSQGQRNNALQDYLESYNEFQNNQSNTYNRYAALAGVGQTATTQANQASQNEAGNVSNIIMSGGQQQAGYALDAGNARASAYANMGSLFGNAAGGVSNSFGLSQILPFLQMGRLPGSEQDPY